MLSRYQKLVLQTLADANEPLFNGTLAAKTGLAFNSAIFGSLERRGWIEGHPFRITDAGRAALSLQEGGGK